MGSLAAHSRMRIFTWIAAGGIRTNPSSNHKTANHMNGKKPVHARRLLASHVVEAELEHLDWATKQPALQMFDASYWRRRVLAVKGRFELTEQQVRQLEKILQRLGQSAD
jgi:hypothetical protein